MSVVKPARKKRLPAAEYVIPSLSVDLCFSAYKSPGDIQPEHLQYAATWMSTKKTEKCPGLLPAVATKPAFITALATGGWPSAGALPSSVEKTSKGESWQLIKERPFHASRPYIGSICIPPERLQQYSTYGGNPLYVDTTSQQQPLQQLSVRGAAPALYSPSGARLSICVSRQCSIISLCAPPRNLPDGTVLEHPKHPKVRVRFVIAGVRLSHNQLITLENLVPSLNRVMPSPTNNLQWLDLAHNQLTSIHPALVELTNLRVLYLHSNLIADFAQVQTLRLMKRLQILTLLGNPIESENCRMYRLRVLALLPHLRVLDYTAVSKDDFQATQAYGMDRAKPQNGRIGSRQKP